MSGRAVYNAMARASVSSVSACLLMDELLGKYWADVSAVDLRNVIDHLANVERRLAAAEALVLQAEEDRRVAQEGSPFALLAYPNVDCDDLRDALEM